MSQGEIVAQSRSKSGGRCADGGCRIEPKGLIFKVSQNGQTTKAGNGPGRWVCVDCAQKYGWAR
jgi:hypothetical protein